LGKLEIAFEGFQLCGRQLDGFVGVLGGFPFLRCGRKARKSGLADKKGGQSGPESRRNFSHKMVHF
jgi:hypothetical protein